MQPTFVLVHSPSVGPLTWTPVADRLRARGFPSVVPSLLDVAEADPPFWPRVVEDVTAAMNSLDQDASVLLVAHSNAGLFVPLLAAHASRVVRGCLFVDAALPALAETTPVAPAELLDFLRSKVTGERLPPWTQWWDEEDIAPMFPNPQLRAAVTAEEPRLPLAYYQQTIPVPAGWDDVPCGYLLFGAPYDEAAADASRRGWLVERLPGEHLHQIVDPDATTDSLIGMAQRLGATDGLSRGD
jgi:pimeloyl-ACP methyl ester carboxylesterase